MSVRNVVKNHSVAYIYIYKTQNTSNTQLNLNVLWIKNWRIGRYTFKVSFVEQFKSKCKGLDNREHWFFSLL